MYISNRLPIVYCSEKSLRIEDFELNDFTQLLLINPLASYFDKKHFYEVNAVLVEYLKANMLAGYIAYKGDDYVFFNGDKDAFLPNLRGIGRINITDVFPREDIISVTTWKYKAKKFLLGNSSLYSATPITENGKRISIFLSDEDWPQLISKQIDHDEFTARFSLIIAMRIEEQMRSNFSN